MDLAVTHYELAQKLAKAARIAKASTGIVFFASFAFL
jgi:hypothetical protein